MDEDRQILQTNYGELPSPTGLQPPHPVHQPHDVTPDRAGGLPKRTSLQQPTVTLGHDTETGAPLTIGDTERRGGLYVLGRSGTGKSTLLLNMIDQDLKNGHGVFFLDPHGVAIDDLIKSGPLGRLRDDLIILDPEDETHSFGINILACRDVTDRKARTETYRRAYDVFQKNWEREWQDRPWLQLMVQYVIYVFLENPDYTLSDVPRFLDDPAFRHQLLRNVQYNVRTRDFWQTAYQEYQKEAMETRIYRLLGDSYLEHIISQRETTINFTDIMAKQKIVLVRLSQSLPSDIKTFIGTILISELMQAIQARANMPDEKRHHFCIFIDEFQNFASYKDVSILYTQARKFNIATTVAHQERFGQFGDNKAILGATDAAANKVFFQLTVRDAQEQAPEMAQNPPMEIKLERKIAIDQEPFWSLLAGHDNPEIRQFARKYLRPLKERKDDLEAELVIARIRRLDFLDQAALDRIDVQIESMYLGHGLAREHALHTAKQEILRARQLTAIMQDSWQQSRVTTQTIRSLNAVMVAIMEGELKPWPGEERFSEFLIECARHSSFVPWRYVEILSLYLSLVYGDPAKPRAIPRSFAQARGIFTEEVNLLINRAAEQTTEAKRKFRERYLKQQWEFFFLEQQLAREARQRQRDQQREQVEQVIYPGLVVQGKGLWSLPNLYINFVWLCAFPDLWNSVAPYCTKEFASRWKKLIANDDWKFAADIPGLLAAIHAAVVESTSRLSRDYDFVSQQTAGRLLSFLETHREGAFVVLALTDAARCGGWRRLRYYLTPLDPEPYPYTSLFDLPGIAETDPVEILRIVRHLNTLMRSKQADKEAFLDTFLQYFRKSPRFFDQPEGAASWTRTLFGDRTPGIFNRAGYLTALEEETRFPRFTANALVLEDAQTRKDLALLTPAITARWQDFSHAFPAEATCWTRCDDLTRRYLLTRACDLVLYGARTADLTTPLPTFPGAGELVTSLVWLFQETEARLAKSLSQ